MKRRVVVTGLGAISSLGTNVERFWEGCLEGASVVASIPSHWRRYATYRSSIWSPLPDLDDATLGTTRAERAQNDPVALIAARAAREALESAGLVPEQKSRRANTFTVPGVDSERTGVYMGTGIGGANSFLENHAFHVLSRTRDALREIAAGVDPPRGPELDGLLGRMVHGPRFNPFSVSMLMPNAVSAMPGIKYSLHGPNVTYAVACASGTVAIGRAFEAVRRGEVDHALAGGAEYLDDDYGGIFQGFDIARTLVRRCESPDEANRPFDAQRSGFLFSEGGAGVLLLEELDRAIEAGRRPMAEILGYGESFDAHTMMSIEPSGDRIVRMIEASLGDAGLEPGAVDYVNAHGTGTQANDEVEARVIARVFRDDVLVNATKSLLGHTIGASGALEAIVTALSLRDGVTHPCRNLDEPVAPLRFVRESGTRCDMRIGFSHSFAFGGHNAGLVIGRAPEI